MSSEPPRPEGADITFEDVEYLEFHDKPIQAIVAYQKGIARCEAKFDQYVNLAVLYFECLDEGYAAHHHLPDDLCNTAYGRAYQVLDLAEFRFRWHPEIEFWRKYIAIFAGVKDEHFHDQAERLVERGRTAVPYFYLLSGPRGPEHVEAAKKLLEAVKEGRTAKERYIRGVLRSHVFDDLLGHEAR